MNGPPGLFAGYPGSAQDEAVDAGGGLSGGYATLEPALSALGPTGLAEAAAAMTAEREAHGVAVSTWRDGRPELRALRLDPVPRVLTAAAWAPVAAGVEQRHRAVNAFLADVYRAAGRRRDDPDRAPEVVRAGVLPEWVVAGHPVRDPEAVGLAWPGQPRAALAAADVARVADGRWLVLEDWLGVPSGLGHALAARRSIREGVAAVFPRDGGGPADPSTAMAVLRGALLDAAPPGCAGAPSVVVLSSGELDASEFEAQFLAEALGVPLVRPANLWPRADAGLEAAVGGRRIDVDVVFRRIDDAELAVHRTPTGQSLTALLRDGVRAGRLGLVNVPGNGVADDRAACAWVPAMIRFYLGEEPLLAGPRTWALADEGQWAEVRGRLHQLVLKPVGGYGGGGVVRGPACSAAELAQLQAEVAAAPHRFVAQEPVELSTAPTFADGALVPRPVELRVFSVADAGGAATALPAPLTRVLGGEEPAVKDTWLLKGPPASHPSHARGGPPQEGR